jgi:hypothetical protein
MRTYLEEMPRVDGLSRKTASSFGLTAVEKEELRQKLMGIDAFPERDLAFMVQKMNEYLHGIATAPATSELAVDRRDGEPDDEV